MAYNHSIITIITIIIMITATAPTIIMKLILIDVYVALIIGIFICQKVK